MDDNEVKGLESLRELKREYQSLLEHPAWHKLVAVVQKQVDELQQALLMPLRSQDEVFLREFNKGQLEGRLSLTNTIETLIETLEMDIRKAENERDGE